MVAKKEMPIIQEKRYMRYTKADIPRRPGRNWHKRRIIGAIWVAEQRWQDGYDYASGALLRGEERKLEIEVSNPFDPNEFEDGMRAAMLDWSRRQQR